MNKFFAVVEIQVNEGIPSSPDVVFTESEQRAQGEMYAKLGYAYQNPREYTSVVIIDEAGRNITSKYGIKNVIDNREEKVPVFAVVEIQYNEGVRSAVPVNVQIGEDAESVIMQVYHGALQYAWNIKRNYTEAVVINTEGRNTKFEVIDFMPEPAPEPEPEA